MTKIKPYVHTICAIIVVIGITTSFFLYGVLQARANTLLPTDVEIFQLDNEGLTCVIFPDGSGNCFCPCMGYRMDVTEMPANSTNIPGDTPDPTFMPDSTNTPKTQHCNQGRGNGPEACSPGKSDNTVNPNHPHGPNDEPPVKGRRN